MARSTRRSAGRLFRFPRRSLRPSQRRCSALLLLPCCLECRLCLLQLLPKRSSLLLKGLSGGCRVGVAAGALAELDAQLRQLSLGPLCLLLCGCNYAALPGQGICQLVALLQSGCVVVERKLPFGLQRELMV